MLNIIPTLTVMKAKEEYELMVRNYTASNSYLFRCNATRFDNKTYIESIDVLQDIYYKTNHKYFDLMLDIPCPKDKIRIKFISDKNDIPIETGSEVRITNNLEKYIDDMIYADFDLDKIGDKENITLGDGDIFLKVISKDKDVLHCEALNSGLLGYRKALYSSKISCNNTENKVVEEKVELIKLLKPSYIALSFTESAEDITTFKNRISEIQNYNPKIIAKLETKKAVENIDDITSVTSNLMISRGDLALSSGYENLYKYQSIIIDRCLKEKGCSVFFASEIINSLVNSLLPTRPEVCDLANMISNGAENIILSGPLCRYDNYNTAVNYIEKMYKIYRKNKQLNF